MILQYDSIYFNHSLENLLESCKKIRSQNCLKPKRGKISMQSTHWQCTHHKNLNSNRRFLNNSCNKGGRSISILQFQQLLKKRVSNRLPLTNFTKFFNFSCWVVLLKVNCLNHFMFFKQVGFKNNTLCLQPPLGLQAQLVQYHNLPRYNIFLKFGNDILITRCRLYNALNFEYFELSILL